MSFMKNQENYKKLCHRIRIIAKRISLPEGQELELLPDTEDYIGIPGAIFDTLRLSTYRGEYPGMLEELPVLHPFIIRALAGPLEKLPPMLDHDSLIVRYLVKGRLELGI